MIPQQYDLPIAYRGDTYQEIGFTINVNAVPLDLTTALINIHIKKGNEVVIKLSTSDNTIQITKWHK